MTALEKTLDTLNHWEISNIIWSLGKMNTDYDSHIPDNVKTMIFQRLANEADKLKQFDVESIFVGLGLMEVRRIYDLC
jgi:hypothetical protein